MLLLPPLPTSRRKAQATLCQGVGVAGVELAQEGGGAEGKSKSSKKRIVFLVCVKCSTLSFRMRVSSHCGWRLVVEAHCIIHYMCGKYTCV